MIQTLRTAVLLGLTFVLSISQAEAQEFDTTFTYQGEIRHAGQPAEGFYDFEFTLFDSATGVTELGALQQPAVTVRNGIFSVDLDFGGAPFAGDSLWLEISVQVTGSLDEATTLSPRQPLNTTPYAIHAEFVGTDAIGSAEILDASIQGTDLGTASVGPIQLSDGGVTATKIAVGAVGSAAVADNTLTAVDIAEGAVGASELADNAVDEAALMDGAVTRRKLADGAVGIDQIDPLHVQRRISTLCPVGRLLRGVNDDGTVVCGVPNKHTIAQPAFDSGNSQGAGFNSAIVIGTDGLPVIAYPTLEVNPSALAVVKCNDLACTGGDDQVVIAPASNFGGQPSMAMASNGLPLIVFTSSGSVRVARCADIDCRVITVSIVDPFASGINPTVVIGDDQLPVIAYTDTSPNRVMVAKCNDPVCAGEDETLSVVDPDTTGFDTTIALGIDGFPVIAYAATIDGSLRIAKCNDSACNGGDETITILDDLASGTVGRDNDLLVPVDGLPLVVYRDGGINAMKAVKCNDPACSGGDDIPQILDQPATQIGLDTAIVLGVDGNPLITYWDFDLEELRIVRCNDPDCAGSDEDAGVLSDFNITSTGTNSGLDMVIGVDGLPIISFGNPSAIRSLGLYRCGRSDCRPF